MDTKRIKVIGLGGIGSYLIEPLCRYLSHQNDYIELTLVDGDTYEDRNKQRQQFSENGNKATVTAGSLRPKFPEIHFRHKPEFVTDENVVPLIRENDIVFLCVDNHATRKVVSDRCEELDNVTLISGGNDETDGNVIYYYRKDGKDVTKPLTKVDPKIANPKDVNPGVNREGCEASVNSTPQLLFTNLAIASMMCNVYYAHEKGKADFEQVYVDISTLRSKPAPEKF
jgi:molybdopterin/thiamine biosynthesis adenylyltransferase